jgi:filamentous hemagglutinin family protein
MFANEGQVVMMRFISRYRREFIGMSILLLVGGGNVFRVYANPTGGAVAQGAATFNSFGSQLTINQTSANAFINWQSFNIGLGETTTFVQPSSSAVAFNHISDSNPSQILGTLNANGYVILQNAAGFYVGGQATINTHGLIMTTASTPALDLSSGGPWSFNVPPPTAKIVNYGQINIAGGGPAYLIANDIENNGVISAPGGKIGLYAGEQVLVSTAPDGRGLSAEATVPAGAVNNQGQLTADAGNIVLNAQTVNQNGLIQANSAKDVNGIIELVAGDAVNLGANSVISAQGDSQDVSPGGAVTIQSGNNFSDQTGSTINVAGGAQGGNGGQVEISAPQMSAINSSVNGQAEDGFLGGALSIDPMNIVLSSSGDNAPASGTVNASDPPVSGTLTLNVNSFASTLSQINLQASQNITLSTTWTLANQTAPATLSLSAGNNIILNGSINAGNNWSINLTAGTQVTSQSQVTSGNDGIYLNGNSYIQAQNGDINLNAANEVIVSSGAIRTVGGGNLSVTTQFGNVNSGTNPRGFNYSPLAPYYTPDANLGGISTAAGGDVNITAGGDVISFSTTTVAVNPASATAGDPDPGTGAFGSEPGDVTINAGGSVYGCYVVINGTGTINAGGNIGTSAKNVALSLATGSWSLNSGWDPVAKTVQSGTGDIYLQEVRNPNGVFNNTTTGFGSSKKASAGNHLFDYDPQASVSLTAGNGVYLTGNGLPRPNGAVPLLMPPTLTINAGPGGVTLQTPSAFSASPETQANSINLLDSDITLFPSSDGNLQITTTGDFIGASTGATLLMSDSARTQWFDTVAANYSGPLPFGEDDHASVPAELNNPDPVILNISGDMENVILQVSKTAQITVGGDLIGSSFYGENLSANDNTWIHVTGQIYNASSFNSVTLAQDFPTLPVDDLPPGDLNNLFQILLLAVNPSQIATLSPTSVDPSQWASYIQKNASMFPGLDSSDLVYDPTTGKLTAIGPLSGVLLTALTESTVTFVVYGPNGLPEVSNGHFVTDTISWTPAGSANLSDIDSLVTTSQGAPPLGQANGAYVVGGMGEFNVTASSISLGNSAGILSVGDGHVLGRDYSFLAPDMIASGASGANINVTVAQDYTDQNGQEQSSLNMPGSTIAALGGGNVIVQSTGGSMDLGSQDLVQFEGEIMKASNIGLGIYTTGGGDVTVTAPGTINIDSSRVGTFNGGDVTVESEYGDVEAGSGGSIAVPIKVFSPYAPDFGEQVYANGIVAETLTQPSEVPGSATAPGDITVKTPQGSIYANLGGIKQEALNGTAPTGPTITLEAGTPANGDWNSSDTPLFVGNIELGTVGVIGETVIAKATGEIKGLVISRHDTSLTSQSVAGLTVLAGGTANISAQTSGSGSGITIIGGAGVNASGIGAGATLLGQNVSVNGGAAASTLGTSATATASSQSAAGQTSNETQQQVAGNDNGNGDEKKKKKKAELVRTVGRVTVILPKSS